MKRLAIGILAHVDSGKTTLSEALLYRGGALRRLGRVDHRDAFLDTDRARARTRYNHLLQAGAASPAGRGIHRCWTRPATPISQQRPSGRSGPWTTPSSSSAARTACRATLKRSGSFWSVPPARFIFVNKLDLPGAEREARLAELWARFGSGCVDLSSADSGEDLALCSEELLDAVLSGRRPEDGQIARAVAKRELFPCFFGSALRLEGVDGLLDALRRFNPPAARGRRLRRAHIQGRAL